MRTRSVTVVVTARQRQVLEAVVRTKLAPSKWRRSSRWPVSRRPSVVAESPEAEEQETRIRKIQRYPVNGHAPSGRAVFVFWVSDPRSEPPRNSARPLGVRVLAEHLSRILILVS